MGKKESAIALTRREREVLVELCRPVLEQASFTEPAATKDVARALFVTEAAVKQHLLRMYDKLEIPEDGNRRLALANAALERGIVTASELGGAPPEERAASAPAPPAESEVAVALREGREAAKKRAWEDAFAKLSIADAAGALAEPGDLAALGEAALWTGHHPESVSARQRAYASWRDRGEPDEAAIVALDLFINFIVRSKFAVGGGWLSKARRVLEGRPEGRAHGRLAAMEALALLARGNLDEGGARAAAALRIGAASGDRDAHVLGQAFTACVLARSGEAEKALSLFDEAMASATAGELGQLATGIVYCRTLCTCIDQMDYRRAGEWVEAIEEASGRGAAGLPGDCRAHRASVLVATGDWARADVEVSAACVEAERFDFGHVALALCELGALRLRRGEEAGADDAFVRAHALGAVPEPGMSLLRLARGDVAAAAASIDGALSASPPDPISRAKLLPARIEIALAAGDRRAAEQAGSELEGIAARYPANDALAAAAAHGRGVLALSRGAHGDAIAHLRRGARLYLETNLPYEASCARLDLGRALAAHGDSAGAGLELRVARESFARLGAARMAERSAESSAKLGVSA